GPVWVRMYRCVPRWGPFSLLRCSVRFIAIDHCVQCRRNCHARLDPPTRRPDFYRLTRSSMFHIQGAFMAFATPDQYAEMIDAAKTGGYAYSALNVTSSQTLNGTLRGFAEAESDGIIAISNRAAKSHPCSDHNELVAGSR